MKTVTLRLAAFFIGSLILMPMLPAAATGTTTVRALLILAGFPDAQSNLTRQDYQKFFNSFRYEENNADRSVRGYIYAISRGEFDMETDVTEWITLPQPASYYESLDNGGQSEGPAAMVRDAISLLDETGFDFSPYDNNGDGYAEVIGLVHRGSNPAFGTGQAPDWSCLPYFLPPITAGDIAITRAWMITDSNPAFGTMTTIGGVLHEMAGHMICNVPDLNTWAAGSWDQMYLGDAFSPTHFSAYTKANCGWVTILNIDRAQTITILPVELTGTAFRLWVDPYRESEYFLLENRQRLWGDDTLPGTGLLIWHVDEWADQDNFLRLEQADGRDDLAQVDGFGYADASDPFPGSGQNQAFTDDTTPSSRSRSGDDTGIRVEEITETDEIIKASISPSPGLIGVTLKYDETYPAWGWVWTPPQDDRAGERTAVEFSVPLPGELQSIRIQYQGRPLDPGFTMPFSMNIHAGFLDDGTLPDTPLRSIQKNLFSCEQSGNWYTVDLASPLPVSAGDTVVVDLTWDHPMIVIDLYGRNSGHSFYRPPAGTTYSAMDFDLRVRARIRTD